MPKDPGTAVAVTIVFPPAGFAYVEHWWGAGASLLAFFVVIVAAQESLGVALGLHALVVFFSARDVWKTAKMS